jgi:hypothetical protein
LKKIPGFWKQVVSFVLSTLLYCLNTFSLWIS